MENSISGRVDPDDPKTIVTHVAETAAAIKSIDRRLGVIETQHKEDASFREQVKAEIAVLNERDREIGRRVTQTEVAVSELPRRLADEIKVAALLAVKQERDGDGKKPGNHGGGDKEKGIPITGMWVLEKIVLPFVIPAFAGAGILALLIRVGVLITSP